MSYYQRIIPPCPPGPNPWSHIRNERQQDSEQPCAQDSSFYTTFTTNPPSTLPAEHWPSLHNWIAHQKEMRLQEAKRQLADQLYCTIEVEDLRTAALRKMHMEEDEGVWQQQQNDGSNGFHYPPAETADGGELSLDPRYEESMQVGLNGLPPRTFVVYHDDASVNGSGQIGAGEVVYPTQEPVPGEYYPSEHNEVGRCWGDWTGTTLPAQQQYQDDIPPQAPLVPSSEPAKVHSVGSADGLAAFVAELKSQMAEKINSGDFILDASTAHGYQQYTRTPEFFKARRNGGTAQVQNKPISIGYPQAGELPEASEEQMPNLPTSSGDAPTPDLCSDSQRYSQDSTNSLERLPEDPVYRSPDGPMPDILAPQPVSPGSALLQMTSESFGAAEENYLYQGYGLDGTEALHWQLPDWVWHHKPQEEDIMNGVSYDFNYPPCGYAATPEFVELHYGGETDYQMSVEYNHEAEAPKEEVNGHVSMPPQRSPSEYQSGCTPRYLTDPQPPICSKEPVGAPIDLLDVPIPPWPLRVTEETVARGYCKFPEGYEKDQAIAPADIPQQPAFGQFVPQQPMAMNFTGREAFMSEVAFNYFEKPRPVRPGIEFDLLPAASGSRLPAWPRTPEFERAESLSASRTPSNRFSRPVDSDPLTPRSPIFKRSTFPDPGQFNVHNTNTEHLFTPSPREPGSALPPFVLHTRKSIRNKNRWQPEVQSVEAIVARRATIDAYLGIPSELPALPVWPTPEPETPPSSPYPYSVDTPSPSVLVHERHLKIRRAKLLAAQQQAMPVVAGSEQHQTNYTNAQQYRY